MKVFLAEQTSLKAVSERQLTNKVAFLVFNWSASAASPPGLVRQHLGLYLGVVSLLLLLLSPLTLLSVFDLDTVTTESLVWVSLPLSVKISAKCLGSPLLSAWREQ